MPATTMTRTTIGTWDGQPVDRFELDNGTIRVGILAFGAVIQDIHVPDRDGTLANVNLGFADLEPYTRKHPHFGAVLGRFANRIAPPSFTIDGETFHITDNKGGVSAHGGNRPFDTFLWNAAETTVDGGPAVALTHISPEGEEGYPGTLTTTVTYSITPDHGLRLDYHAETDRPTVVNLTNHAYFNLAGEGTGTIDDHILQLNAAAFTPTDERQVTTGEIAPVDGTVFDFRTPKRLGAVVRDSSHPQIRLARGLDHNVVVDRPAGEPRQVVLAATLTDPASGRVMDVLTDQPGMQVYAANSLDGSFAGASGRLYRQGDAICFETQAFPNAPNHPHFPSSVVRPGTPFTTTTIYRFRTE